MNFAVTLALAAIVVLALPTEACAGAHPGLRVAVAQIPIEDGDLRRNMRLAEDAIRAAAKEDPDLVCVPEAADYGWLDQQSREHATPIPNEYTKLLSALAREHRIWISAGCLEKDGDKVYNSAVIIDRSGEIVLKHRKIKTLKFLTKHLYDSGNVEDTKTVDTEFGTIGMTICADNFDLGIPARVAKMGAWLLITPHGFAAEESNLEKNGKDYRNHIANIASHTKMWVIGADAVLGTIKGGAWKGQLHSGCSTIADPGGRPVAVGKFKEPDLIFYDIPAEQ